MELKSILEAILFSAQKPLSPSELKDIFARAAEHAEDEAPRGFKRVKLDDLNAALAQLDRSTRAGAVSGWCASPARGNSSASPNMRRGSRRSSAKGPPPRLAAGAGDARDHLRQPITRVEMEQIRGVSVDGVLQTLVERGGRASGPREVVGRPMTYGTTKVFLEYFGCAVWRTCRR